MQQEAPILLAYEESWKRAQIAPVTLQPTNYSKSISGLQAITTVGSAAWVTRMKWRGGLDDKVIAIFKWLARREA